MITREQIVEETKSWVGTPWQHQACVKGDGVDCAMMVVGVAMGLDLTNEEQVNSIPNYPRDWHFHNEASMLLPIVESFDVEQIDFEDMKPGDILIFKVAKCESHLGILVSEDTFVHAFNTSKVKRVVETRLDDRWTSRLSRVYSFTEVE